MTTAERLRTQADGGVPAARVRAYYESVGYQPLRLRLSRSGAAWRLTLAAADRTPTTLWVGGSWERAWAVLRDLWAEMETSTVYIPSGALDDRPTAFRPAGPCPTASIHRGHYWSTGRTLRLGVQDKPHLMAVHFCPGIHKDD